MITSDISAPLTAPKTELPKLPLLERSKKLMRKSGLFMATLFLNIVLLLLLSSWVIYTLAPSRDEPMIFAKLSKAVTPPPQKPPAKGGDAARSLADPSTTVIPNIAAPSIVSTTALMPTEFTSTPTMSITTDALPNMQMPSGSGLSSAAGTSGGGISQTNPFGDSPTSGTVGLIGELYDLKQKQDGTPTDIAIVPPEGDSYEPGFLNYESTKAGLRVLRDYVKNWDQSILDQYYKSPDELQASQMFIPIRPSLEATEAFKVADKVKAKRWVAHYHGTIVAPKSGKFRFLGYGDDFLVVRIGETNVLDGSCHNEELDLSANGPDEDVPGPAGQRLRCGQWFELAEGQAISMDILIGEGPGGVSGFYLLIEEEGDTSPKGDYPVFQIAKGPIPSNDMPPVFTGKTMVFGAQ